MRRILLQNDMSFCSRIRNGAKNDMREGELLNVLSRLVLPSRRSGSMSLLVSPSHRRSPASVAAPGGERKRAGGQAFEGGQRRTHPVARPAEAVPSALADRDLD